jgi:DnaJ-like protein/DUF3102 family protein
MAKSNIPLVPDVVGVAVLQVRAKTAAQIPLDTPRAGDILFMNNMPAPRKDPVELYALGRRLLEARRRMKHGAWLPWLRAQRISQPTAWRAMRFAEAMESTPHRLLGVDRKADAQTIQSAYRRLARQHHPDVAKGPAAAARFRAIHEAYQKMTRKRKGARR